MSQKKYKFDGFKSAITKPKNPSGIVIICQHGARELEKQEAIELEGMDRMFSESLDETIKKLDELIK